MPDCYIKIPENSSCKIVKAKLISDHGVPNPTDGSAPYALLSYVYTVDGTPYVYNCTGSYYDCRRNAHSINLLWLGNPATVKELIPDSDDRCLCLI